MQDPINETFTEFLKNLKKTAKEAFGNEAENHIETSLFVSLPVEIQELTMTNKKTAH